MTDRIRQRIETLEKQLHETTQRRDQAQAVLNESFQLINQIQGALAVLRDLLVPTEVPTEIVAKEADG